MFQTENEQQEKVPHHKCGQRSQQGYPSNSFWDSSFIIWAARLKNLSKVVQAWH